MKIVVKKRGESHLLCNKEKDKWIEDYVDREAAPVSRLEYYLNRLIIYRRFRADEQAYPNG